MTWKSDQPNGGFSGDTNVESWLPVDERHIAKGGFEQQGKQGSLFERNKAHLEWRKDQAALVNNGQIDLLDVDDDVIAFNRRTDDGDASVLCLFNFSDTTKTVMGVNVQPWSAAFK